ncbi:jg18569 [Pararge aegeria aegeria]|uniref:Jg18569 protein n=1 Tax=Pararge aegeria aegeria TaxID=348720 RepID=A0A8S4S315_9NEOP|nr:jg18569 [Pararge aegeria aegeria]
MFDVKDKVFLITGAASGIGAGVTRAVLDRGAKFSNCLGMEQNYSRSGVRVIAICFGITDTNLIRGRIGCIDEETEERMLIALKKFPAQCVDSAVSGLIAAYVNGDSGSTWLITTNRPALDITNNVKKAFEILGQGVFD